MTNYRKVVSELSVKVGKQTISYVEPGNDKSSSEAMSCADALFSQMPYKFSDAIVDRFDGLVLFSPKNEYGFHFVNANCGYYGQGPMATAQILDLFGFGIYEYILAKISSGGDTAYFHLIKDQGFVRS